MALVNDVLGTTSHVNLGKSALFTTTTTTTSNVYLNRKNDQFSFTPSRRIPIPAERRGLRSRKAVITAALSDWIVLPKAKTAEFKVRAVVTVRNKHKEDLKDAFVKHFDALTDEIGRKVVLELVSNEIDPKTKAPKKSKQAVLKDWSKKSNSKTERVNFIAEFGLDSNFGVPGAITVLNRHQQEFFLESIIVEGFECGPLHFSCNSWVQSRKDHPGKRVFFSNQPYLPNETPSGLKTLREKELRELRGDGNGERKLSDRVYDFDIYNDLGNPDKGIDFARPVLGGHEIPYPRRCRTGRPPTDTDMNAESRVEKPLPMYVPRDEQFEESKEDAFSTGRLKGALHILIPSIMAGISAKNKDFKCFVDIDNLYTNGLQLGVHDELFKSLPLPKPLSKFKDGDILKYGTPKIISKDKFAWLRDDEFARQAIAGVNPVSIERLQVFPPVSKLDPKVYGPLDSALKEEHIIGHLNGMTVQQALEANKLYILDHHDAYLPFLDLINALDGHKTYATRTVFFLSDLGTLKPIAIELSLPDTGLNTRGSKRIVTPPVDATTSWMWLLAKAHVCSNDAGVHQLVHHWLRTHAALEPFIVAAHRQMSAMHPIFKLLDPHMRYTMDVNGLARQSLINADGVIESCFTPGRYCMEISAAAYKNSWRFDQEGLPADLIRRGMAVPDPTQPHGLKLLIEDYPYAADGLLIWGSIENLVRKYVNHYYPNSAFVCNDRELQAWYAESINVGHADLRHEEWWPTLATPEDLTSILTTLIWLASAQHAALNFGQYPYGGYVPNRPPLMRRLIPEETDLEYAVFMADPEKYFLSALPSLLQATKYMAVVDNLSSHSPDEEYIGERNHSSTWTGDAEMIEAFYEFSSEIGRIEKEIEKRNKDSKLRNRCGAGVLPYELLAPSSEPGVTCRGVPNSVSI